MLEHRLSFSSTKNGDQGRVSKLVLFTLSYFPFIYNPIQLYKLIQIIHFHKGYSVWRRRKQHLNLGPAT